MMAPRLFTRYAHVTPPPEGEARLALGRPGGGRMFLF
jgi:hypothetical protein